MGGRITRLVPWTLLLRGDRVECPCCGGRFRRFRPRGSRRDAECPRCRSLERHRVMWLYLERETGLFRDSLDVLHVAPEPWLERRLRGLPRIRYVGGDLRPTGEQVRLDLTAVPYPDASFDLAICAHVLDEIPDDRLAMRELRRVLRPGGALVLQTPIDESREETLDLTGRPADERRRVLGTADDSRVYGLDFERRLADAGFDVERDRYAERLDPELVRRCALRAEGARLNGEDVFLARPRAES